jgi:hypothetical protein
MTCVLHIKNVEEMDLRQMSQDERGDSWERDAEA